MEWVAQTVEAISKPDEDAPAAKELASRKFMVEAEVVIADEPRRGSQVILENRAARYADRLTCKYSYTSTRGVTTDSLHLIT